VAESDETTAAERTRCRQIVALARRARTTAALELAERAIELGESIDEFRSRAAIARNI
jgi:hypothetical protein